MRNLSTRLEQYFSDVLSIKLTIFPCEGDLRVPLFLQDRYRFLLTDILNVQYLMMVDVYNEEESPAVIRKHIEQVRLKWDGSVIYVRDRVTAYNRKRLIEHKVPFVVPQTQMYLPMLGIDLREYFRTVWEEKKTISPSAQVVLIYALLNDDQILGPTALSVKLGYSIMAMSRALDELEAAELVQTSVKGRRRQVRFVAPPCEVWKQAQPLLRSPVTRQYKLQRGAIDQPFGPRSGLEALAHYSMLVEPENSVVAIARKEKVFQRGELVPITRINEPGETIIEAWSYAPVLFAEHGFVDRLSLFLSLRETEDERVLMALEEMIREVVWSEV